VVLLWCLLSLALYAQARAGVITGTIRRADGAPAVDVRVAAVSVGGVAAAKGGGQALDGIARTDAVGRYRLDGLPAGRYYVLAGTLNDPTYFPGVNAVKDARAVTVAGGGAIGNIDMTLRLLAVRGRVTGMPAGVPSDLFSVVLSPTDGGAPLKSTVKADGSFEFPEAPRGTYHVSTNPRSLAPADGPVPRPPLIEVRERDLPDLKMALPLLMVGRVETDDGASLPIFESFQSLFASGAELPSQVAIRARESNNESLAPISVYARSDGWFAAAAFGGEYTVAVSLPFGYRVKSILQGSETLTNGPLIVGETNSEPVRITLTRAPLAHALPTFTVAGRIDGAAAVPDRPLRLSGASRATDGVNSIYGIAAENRMGEVSVQPDRSFEFHGVPPGFYELTGNGLETVTVAVTASDVRGIELVPSLAFLLQQAESSPPSPGGGARLKVSGKVTNLPANRAVNPQIRLGGRLQTSMNPDGSFEFRNVPPGTYNVGWTGIYVEGGPTGAILTSSKVVVTDQDVTGVTLELPFGISVIARVALEGASKTLVPGAYNLNWLYRSITSLDATIGGVVRPGVYAINPHVPGYRLISVTAAGADVLKTGLWLDGSSNTVELLFTLEHIP
jgi:hypothetical protein